MDGATAIGMLGALAQPTRLRVVAVLKAEFPRGLAVGEIASRADTPQNTMSSHLAILARAGLVVARREGRIIRYSLEPGGLHGLVEFLAGDLPLQRV